jgi:hypothetical protein
MDELLNDLIYDFNNMNMSINVTDCDKIKTKSFINVLSAHSKSDNINNNDVYSLLSDFNNLSVAENVKDLVINKLYKILVRLLAKDRKYVNSTLFIPPEPPMCR